MMNPVWDLTFRVKLSCLYFLGKYWYDIGSNYLQLATSCHSKSGLLMWKLLLNLSNRCMLLLLAIPIAVHVYKCCVTRLQLQIIKIGQTEWGIPCWFLSLITMMRQCQHFRLWMKIWFQVTFHQLVWSLTDACLLLL